MCDFLIQLTEGMVRASRIIDGKLELITFMGEKSIPIDSFWSKFKDKIEYSESDELAFINVLDQCDFPIDPSINIASSFVNSNDDISRIIYEIDAENVLFFPEISVEMAQKNTDKDKFDVFDSGSELRATGLQGYYLNKTREYKKD